MKEMTYKEFKRSFESLAGFIKHRTFYYHQMEVQFTPAHKGFEIKMPHTFVVVKAYSKGQDATYLWIVNKGIINLGLFDDDRGVVLKLHGDVSGKKIQERFTKSKNLLQLLNDMYEYRINHGALSKKDEVFDEFEAYNS